MSPDAQEPQDERPEITEIRVAYDLATAHGLEANMRPFRGVGWSYRWSGAERKWLEIMDERGRRVAEVRGDRVFMVEVLVYEPPLPPAAPEPADAAETAPEDADTVRTTRTAATQDVFEAAVLA